MTNITKQAGTVWARKSNSLLPFNWLGRCAYIDGDITSNEGGLTVTQRANPRGGIERDGVILEPPGESSLTLMLKRKKGERIKTELRSCLWDIDERVTCGGKDKDAHNSWDEITRTCTSKLATRALGGTSIQGTDEEAMISAPFTGLETVDIYRVSGAEELLLAAMATDVGLTDVTAAQPERCADECDSQEDCIVYASTLGAVANEPNVLVNLSGGEPGQWTQVVVTEVAVAKDLESIVGFGDFWCASCSGESTIVYSDDRGTTRVEVDIASAPGANSMALDGVDLSFIVLACDGGDIFASTDGARTWSQIADAINGGANLDMIKIAPDNHEVIYALSTANDDVMKSVNGGQTWFLAGSTGGGNHTSFEVLNQNQLLIGTTAGEMWQSWDGGFTFTEQAELPGLTVKANADIVSIKQCGCGIVYCSVFETGVASRVLRNVDGGASGRWYMPEGEDAVTNTNEIKALACCGPNRVVGVGGAALVSSAIVLA